MDEIHVDLLLQNPAFDCRADNQIKKLENFEETTKGLQRVDATVCAGRAYTGIVLGDYPTLSD